MTLSPRNIFIAFLTLFSVFSACHAILHKRDPRAAFGWVATCLVFIGIGPCLYWLFGINRIRVHAKDLYHLEYWRYQTKGEREKWTFDPSRDSHFYSKDLKGIVNVSEKVSRRPLTTGNRMEILHDGEETYPAMLRAIRGAREFIYLCTYIFDSDETGRQFVDALAQAQKRGVKVWVLIDAFGEYYSYPPIGRLLKKENVRVGRFLPLSFSVNSLHFNLRNHRKSLVVDGLVGFTGGMNIRGKHFSKDPKVKKPMTDLHFKVEGPVVMELQEIFLEDWHFATGESFPWLAASQPEGRVEGFSTPEKTLPERSVCRAISGGPNEDFEKINWILLGALACAKERIQIMTPYFVPDRVLIAALNSTALRGVNVEVILPGRNNLPFVDWACRALLWEMLEKGVRFYYQPAPFAHSKLFVVDGAYALVGSSNWDSRSLRLNFELDMEIYDKDFCGVLSKHFDVIRAKSEAITFQQLKSEPFVLRFRNSLIKLFSPYL